MNQRTSIRPLWELKELWTYLERVPVVRIEETSKALAKPASIDDVGTIKERWHTFPVGTSVEEIHEWMATQNAGFHPTLFQNAAMRDYTQLATVPWNLRSDMIDDLLLVWEERPYYIAGHGRSQHEQLWCVMFNDGTCPAGYRVVLEYRTNSALSLATAMAERLNVHYRWQKLVKRIGQLPEQLE